MNKCYLVSEKRKELVNDEVRTYIEITINEYFGHLLFKNFYTERIGLQCYTQDGGVIGDALDHVLMNDPNCEINAERYFAINLNSLMGVVQLPSRLRVYLIQTCKIWTNFTINDIKLLTNSEADSCIDNCKYTKSPGCFELNPATTIDLNKIDQQYLSIMKVKDQFDLKFSILK
jgi:hypothetical protein